MPRFNDLPALPSALTVTARCSAAVEFDWALSGAFLLGREQPDLDAAYASAPGLAEDVRRLWGPEETLSYPGFPEISVVAHQGGLLFGDEPGALLAALEELLVAPLSEPALAAEKPEDRERILRRLKLLRSSPKRRHSYVEVVAAVWDKAGPVWEERGRAAVTAAMANRAALIAKGLSWQELLASDSSCANLEELVGDLPPGGELAVVPAFFTHKGLVLDLPGLVLVSVRTDDPASEARSRTEEPARRLKALADPTRLAIVDVLSRQSMTVTQLASTFDLAQPTVSNHVKVLREAGVVASGKDGTKRVLFLQHDVVGALMADLQTIVGERPPAK